MKTIAFCAQSFVEATKTAAGVNDPLTSPPIFDANFDPGMLSGADFLYIHLHGKRGDPFLFGEVGPACTADQIRKCDLSGTVVMALSCYLGEADSLMLAAFLDAGARYVIGAPGENYSGTYSVIGADVLARDLRRWLSVKTEPLQALRMAKIAVRAALQMRRAQLALTQDPAARALIQDVVRTLTDTLEFTAFEKKHE